MYSLETFTNTDVSHCAVALRNLEYESQNMEDAANRIVRYIYDSFLDSRTGDQELALVRFFKTHPFRELNPQLQREAQSIAQERYVPPSTKCLTLMATAGDEPQWNSRYKSNGHQAIPLIDEDFVRQAPMVFQLIQQFGLKVSTVVDTNSSLITKSPHKAFNVFYVPTALNSPYIPAQKKFVVPYRVKSVLGFGGMLPSNELFAVILFSKTFVPDQTANRFKFISAYIRVAVESFNRSNIFASEALKD
ncbi:hypothetical protein D0962_33825 [Leptolyngbyaceae cyanobacterium CCMR0082]|uniref:Uncharacterized protein n=1 Tax=Adonisia turfae CCMR0082 TaxID=2304604 RepID=A0A6M0SH30_9CYAN|nr:hypothetical protein [Adonisia turfae]NEZ67684.1 hypothetical protein [Adonisia turfae CCMR0082]